MNYGSPELKIQPPLFAQLLICAPLSVMPASPSHVSMDVKTKNLNLLMDMVTI
jgi:hypothetical protein